MTSISIVSPSARCRKSPTAGRYLLRSRSLGSSGWRREKASRRCVSVAARWAPRIALAIERCRFAALPPSPWASCLTLSRLPMMIMRRLLKSWAMPPLSWPTASMRWDTASCS